MVQNFDNLWQQINVRTPPAFKEAAAVAVSNPGAKDGAGKVAKPAVAIRKPINREKSADKEEAEGSLVESSSGLVVTNLLQH